MPALGMVIIRKVRQVSNPNDPVRCLFSVLGPKIRLSNLSSGFWVLVSRICNGSGSLFVLGPGSKYSTLESEFWVLGSGFSDL